MKDAEAQLCPVCLGSGEWPPHSEKRRQCHGCDGRGWVIVEKDYYITSSGSSTLPLETLLSEKKFHAGDKNTNSGN